MYSDDEEYEPEYEWEEFKIIEESDRSNNISSSSSASLYTFSVLCVIPPPLEYMSKLHTDQQEISGRQVWTGSLMACHYMARHPDIVAGKTVLELGAGTGVLGMLASRLGGACVALTDGDEPSINLLQRNLEHNNAGGCMATRLLWGDEESIAEFSTFSSQRWPQQFSLSESQSQVSSIGRIKFDRIVAGDVMYKRDLPPLFFKTVNRFLSSDGCLLLFHVPRSCVNHEMVCSAAKTACLHVSKIDIDVSDIQKIHGISIDDAIRGALYIISKKNR